MSKTMAKEKKEKKEKISDKVESIYLPIIVSTNRGLMNDDVDFSLEERRDIIVGLGQKVRKYLASIGYDTEFEVVGKVGPNGDVIDECKMKSLDGVVEGSVVYRASENDAHFHPRIIARFKFDSDDYADKGDYENLSKLLSQIERDSWFNPVANSSALLGFSIGFVSLAAGAVINYCINGAEYSISAPVAGGLLGGLSGLILGSSIGGIVAKIGLESAIKKLCKNLRPEIDYSVQQPRRYEGSGIPPAATLDEEKK